MNTLFILVNLSNAQKRVVRKVCKKQINCLENLLGQEVLDTHIYSAINDVPCEPLLQEISSSHQRFKNLMDEPHTLVRLPDTDLSIFKHILFTHKGLHKYPNATKAIWRKLYTLETLHNVGLN